MREHHSLGQHAGEGEETELLVILEFVAMEITSKGLWASGSSLPVGFWELLRPWAALFY
jgi:hypothetical protein